MARSWCDLARRAKTIKILGAAWRIIHMRDLDMPGETVGLCDPRSYTIFLSSGIVGEAVDECLLHEVIHALLDVSGLAQVLGQEQAEAVANRLSPLLVAVMRDNKVGWDY